MSESYDKLELLTQVAREFLESPAATHFESIELDLKWVTYDYGSTLLPTVSLRLGPARND